MNNGTNEKSAATIRSDEASGGLLVGMRVDPALSARRDAMLDPDAISGAQVELIDLAAKLDELSALGDLFDEEESITAAAPAPVLPEIVEEPEEALSEDLPVDDLKAEDVASELKSDIGSDDQDISASSDEGGAPDDLPTLVPDWARDPSEEFGLATSDAPAEENPMEGWSVEDDAPLDEDVAASADLEASSDVSDGDTGNTGAEAVNRDDLDFPDGGFSRIDEGEERLNAEVSTRLLDADEVRELPETARESFAWEEEDELDEDEGRDFFEEDLPEAFFDDLPEDDDHDEDKISDEDIHQIDAVSSHDADSSREDLHEEDEAWLESVLSEMDDPDDVSLADVRIEKDTPPSRSDSNEFQDEDDLVKVEQNQNPKGSAAVDEDPLSIMTESDDEDVKGERIESVPQAIVETRVEENVADRPSKALDAIDPNEASASDVEGREDDRFEDDASTREAPAKSSSIMPKLMLGVAVVAVTAALGFSILPMLSRGSAVDPVRIAEAPAQPQIVAPVAPAAPVAPVAPEVPQTQDAPSADIDEGDAAETQLRDDIDALRDLALAPSKPEAVGEVENSPLDDLARGLAGPASGDLSDLLLPESQPVIEDVAPQVTEEMLEGYAKTEDIAEVRAAIDRMFEELKGLSNGIMDRDRAIAGLQTEIAEAREQAMRAEALAIAQNEVIVDVIRLQGQMVTAEDLVVDLSRRLADLEGKDPADRIAVDREIEDLDRRISNLARDVGLVARMSLGGGAARPATTSPSAPGSGAVYTRGEADLRPAAANPANVPASAKVGDFVEGYGYVLDVMQTSDGARLVVMENGSVLKP
jgi:hypothetical protein